MAKGVASASSGFGIIGRKRFRDRKISGFAFSFDYLHFGDPIEKGTIPQFGQAVLFRSGPTIGVVPGIGFGR